MSAISKTETASSSAPRLVDAISIGMPNESLWEISEVSGKVEDVLRDALLRAALLNGSFFAEADGGPVRALLKCYRGGILLLEDGRVTSSEHLRFENPREFFTSSPETALASLLDHNSFDNAATLFSDAAMNTSLVRARSYLDGNPETAAQSADAEVRFLEYQVNHLLHRGEIEEDLVAELLEEPIEAPEDLPIPVAPLRSFLSPLRGSLIKEIEELRYAEAERGIYQFRQYLDRQGILPVMQNSGLNGCRWYNWLAGQGKEKGLNHEVGHKRRDALKAFPLIHTLVARHDHPVALAVENGERLVPALTEHLGQPKHIVTALNGVSVKDLGLVTAPDNEAIGEILNSMSHLPKGPPPRGQEEWQAYFSAVRFAENTPLVGVEETRDLIGKLSGKWGMIDCVEMRFAANAIGDMLGDIYSMIIAPAQSHTDVGLSVRELVEGFLGGRDLLQRAKAVYAWGEKRPLIKAELGASYPVPGKDRNGCYWPALHEAPYAHKNDVCVFPLATEADLKEEHRRLRHCIDTYVGNCMYKGSHIVSLRSPDGSESFSTAEIRHEWIVAHAGKKDIHLDPTVGALPPGVRQHFSKLNGNPPHACWEALWSYMEKIVSGSIKIDVDHLEEEMIWRQKTTSTNADYDDSRPEAVEAAWKAYRQFYPKAIRRKDVWAAIEGMKHGREETPSPTP